MTYDTANLVAGDLIIDARNRAISVIIILQNRGPVSDTYVPLVPRSTFYVDILVAHSSGDGDARFKFYHDDKWEGSRWIPTPEPGDTRPGHRMFVYR